MVKVGEIISMTVAACSDLCLEFVGAYDDHGNRLAHTSEAYAKGRLPYDKLPEDFGQVVEFRYVTRRKRPTKKI